MNSQIMIETVQGNKANNEVSSNVSLDSDFTTVTPTKFVGCDGLMTSRDKLNLSRGMVIHVDGFSYHFFTGWNASFKRPSVRKTQVTVLKKKAKKVQVSLKKKSVDSIDEDMKILSMQDTQFFIETCAQAVATIPNATNSRFLRNRIHSAIFCGLNNCKKCLEDSSATVAEQVPSGVTSSESDDCDSIDSLRVNNPEEFDVFWNNMTSSCSSEYSNSSYTNPFQKDLCVEGIEPNPGPNVVVGCNHVVNSTFFSQYSLMNWRKNDDCYQYVIYVNHKFGRPHISKRQSSACHVCKRRWFCVDFYTYEEVDEANLRLQSAFEHHPAFGLDFMLMHKQPLLCENDYCRNLTREGVESNPGPSMLNGDTQRKSKSFKCNVPTLERMQRLAQRDDSIGKKNSFQAQELITQRRQNAAHKAVMKQLFPTKQSFLTLDVNHKFEVLTQIQEIVDSLPIEFKRAVTWADVIASIHVLLKNESWSAKYIAFRMLYREFKVQGVDADNLLAMVVGVLSVCAIQTHDVPVRQNSVIDERFDPIATFITVILTFLFGQKPGKDRITNVMDALGHLPRRALGLSHLLEIAKRCLSYVCGISDPNVSLEQQITEINKKVNYWLSREGDNFIMTNPCGFDDVTKTVIDANELERCLPSLHLRRMFSPTLFQLRKIHNRVIQAPVSGHAFRKEPVVLHLVGDPGVGKTMMITGIAADALKCIFELQQMPENEQQECLKNHFQYIYWRPIGHKYETNYNTSLSKIYVVDDANQVHADYLHDDLPFPARLIHYANNADLLLPVAEIENKRTAKFNSDLIIATDNQARPDLSYLQCPEAYLRRIDIQATVSLADEFCTEVNGIRVADPVKFDHTHFDTRAYRFTVGGVMYGYNELISMVNLKLKEKYARFNINHANFQSYATRHWNTPVVNEMPAPFSADFPLLEDRDQNLPVRQSKTEHRRVESVSKVKSKSFILLIPAVLIACLVSFVRGDRDRLTESFHRSIFFVCGSYVQIRDKFKRWWEKDKPTYQRRLFYIASAGALICTSYALYLKFLRKNNEPLTENYSSGDATRTVRKPKNKPRGVITALRKQNETIVHEMEDANRFSNMATTESCLDETAMNLCRKLTSSMYSISVTNPNGVTSKIHGMFVSGRLFMCNAHILDHSKSTWNDCLITLKGIRNSFEDIKGSSVTIWELGHEDEGNDVSTPYDVCFLEFDRIVSDHPNFSKHFMSKSRIDTLKGVKLIVFSLVEESHGNNTTWLVHKQHTQVREVVGDWISSIKDDFLTINYGAIEYAAQTLDGYCGSIILVNDTKYPSKICGIHMASFDRSDICYGAPVSEDMVNCVLAACSKESTFGFDESAIKQSLLTKRTVIDDDLEHVTCIPHLVHAQTRTRILESILHSKISKPTKKPAILGYHTYNNEKFHVVNRAMKKYVGPSLFIDDRLRNVFQAFLRSKFAATRTIKEFDILTAIRGIEGDAFVQAINRSSSPGYPFVKLRPKNKPGKTEFLGEDENFIYDHPVLLREMQNYIDAIGKNERPLCFFTSTAKDELRSLDRVAQGKTRSFAAAPLHFVVMFRQKFLDLFANIMENRILNGSLVGIDPYSQEWDYLCYRLGKIAAPSSKQFLAGDFSNFDGTLNRSLLWEIHTFLETEYNRHGDMLSYSLWCDITNSLQVFGDCAIGVSRGQPSGNPGTTIINSLYNAALLYVVIYDILSDMGPKAHSIQDDLSHHFDAYVYGDDNIMVFSEELSLLLDPRLITAKMLKFGHVYTSDAKDDQELKYRTMFDISILKRHFSFDKDLRKWMAPLELSSILEPLNWDKVDDTQEGIKIEQMSINARTAIRELSMHTPEIFKEYVPKILKVCKDHNITLAIDCYLDQRNLRLRLKNIDVQLPKQQSLIVDSSNIQQFGKDIYLKRPREQPSLSRLTCPLLQNDLTVKD